MSRVLIVDFPTPRQNGTLRTVLESMGYGESQIVSSDAHEPELHAELLVLPSGSRLCEDTATQAILADVCIIIPKELTGEYEIRQAIKERLV